MKMMERERRKCPNRKSNRKTESKKKKTTTK